MAQTHSKQQEPSKAPERRSHSRTAGLPALEPSLTPADWMAASPFTAMRRFAAEMDRLFSGVWNEDPENPEAPNWWPAMDVAAGNGLLTVTMDLPGTRPEDVQIEVSAGSLLIRGERRHEQEEASGGRFRSERHYGSFSRSIPLPRNADVGNAQADFANGELKVTIPFPDDKPARRQIPVRSH